MAGQPISNDTVIAAAVALVFLGCDMALRARLLAECVVNVSRRDIRRQG
jgi:hypothetical protein